MPELPEVETIVRDLAPILDGPVITKIYLGHPSVIRHPNPKDFSQGLSGQKFIGIQRKGKYILCILENGYYLVIHLGMTGHLLVTTPQTPIPKHTHLRLKLDNGKELRFDDARRFGRILLGGLEELQAVGKMPYLGAEPLSVEFELRLFAEQLQKTKRSLKLALLDQRIIAGLGNIYVDEACHLAQVNPARSANQLSEAEIDALYKAIPAVLTKAINNRGTSFDDYRDVWNVPGNNQEQLQVYGRGGQKCYGCSTILEKITLGGRTTVFCFQCQN